MAAVDPLPRRRPDQVAQRVAVVRIDNLKHLGVAYGPAAMTAVQSELRRALGRLVLRGDVLDQPAAGIFAVHFRDTGHLGVHLPADWLLEDRISTIASAPVEHDGLRLHMALSVTCLSGGGGKDDDIETYVAIAERRPAGGDPVSSAQPWGNLYRSDMAAAAELFHAMAHDRLQLAWQPIRHAARTGDILYYECQLRAIDASGELQLPGRYLPSLERLGLMRALDRHVVMSVIEELRRDPSIRLGANISAQSAVYDLWWYTIGDLLTAAPDIASRLVIEITESAAFPSIQDATHFTATLRSFGCCIAIDDFGVGHSAIRLLFALKPDMVKIDAFFVRWGEQTTSAREAVGHLIGLASALASVVIVEGIETAAQSVMVQGAGGVWQQGYHHGRPALTRPSRLGLHRAEAGRPVADEGAQFGRPGDVVVLPARFSLASLRLALPTSLLMWAGVVGAGFGIWRSLH